VSKNTKYTLDLNDTVTLPCGTVLKRVISKKDINLRIKKGSIGGYIEDFHNLSSKGSCWVEGDAKVWGKAEVKDSGSVTGDAKVWGDSIVSDSAAVSGLAEVFDSKLSGSSTVRQLSKVSNCIIGNTADVSGQAVVVGVRLAGNVRVYGNAKITGDISVYHDVRIGENAVIKGQYIFSGNTHIKGDAKINNPGDWVIVGPAISSRRYTTAFRDRKIKVRVVSGCFSGTVEEFSQAIEITHASRPKHLMQYRLFCQLIGFHFGLDPQKARS